jgi:hypothetical protein
LQHTDKNEGLLVFKSGRASECLVCDALLRLLLKHRLLFLLKRLLLVSAALRECG